MSSNALARPGLTSKIRVRFVIRRPKVWAGLRQLRWPNRFGFDFS